MRPNATAFVLVTLAAAVYTASVAAQAITFNVPYTCPDGMTYVVERCEMRGRVEVCYLERWKNGQLLDHENGPRVSLNKRLQSCSVSQ